MTKDKVSIGARSSATTVDQLIDAVIAAWLDDCDLSEQSVRRLIDIAQRFRDFLERGKAARYVDEIPPGCIFRFIKSMIATDAGPQEPALATMHLRRSCLRVLFRTARQLGLIEVDPSVDIELPRRTTLRARALTDEEVALCRSFSLHKLTETRGPAAWALAEATARTSEIPRVAVSDIDLARGRVWLAGGSKVEARWGEFTSWGLGQIRRRVTVVEKQGANPRLVYGGDGSAISRQASSCNAISETLLRAGLSDEPDVRPVSVAAWAATRIFEQTDRIEEVARRLGLRSLDRAAQFIDWEWNTDPESGS